MVVPSRSSWHPFCPPPGTHVTQNNEEGFLPMCARTLRFQTKVFSLQLPKAPGREATTTQTVYVCDSLPLSTRLPTPTPPRRISHLHSPKGLSPLLLHIRFFTFFVFWHLKDLVSVLGEGSRHVTSSLRSLYFSTIYETNLKTR